MFEKSMVSELGILLAMSAGLAGGSGKAKQYEYDADDRAYNKARNIEKRAAIKLIAQKKTAKRLSRKRK